MKKELSKSEAQILINDFFKKPTFTSNEVRKIKRLAMKYKIKLNYQRKQFCKSCLNQLKGKISVTKNSKTVICSNCNYKNKFKIN